MKKLSYEYNYEKWDFIEAEFSDDTSQIYTFTNNNEKLTILDTTHNNKKFIELMYVNGDKSTSVSLFYTPLDTSKPLYTTIKVDDLNLYETLSKIMDNSDSELLKIYNQVIEEIATKKNITLEDIKKLLL